VNLDRWISDGVEPPPSSFPRLADGTAVTAESTAALFTAIPGVRFPDRIARPARLDFGPELDAEGIAGEPKAAQRTIDVRMLDTMRFVPARIDVRLNDTGRFRVRNTGQVMHEFVIGTQAENEAHAALMLKFPDMEHDEPYMAHVAPGKTGTIVWTFNRAGTFEFACLIAGHYQAGMAGTIHVRTS